jgi:hypothetical protein
VERVVLNALANLKCAQVGKQSEYAQALAVAFFDVGLDSKAAEHRRIPKALLCGC